MNFLINGLERRVGIDLNNDGYIGGEGFLSKLERKTHIDFNGDNIIGRPYDIPYYAPSMMHYGGGYPSMSYGGYPSTSYGGFTYGPTHFRYY
ncbi:hypothetical protein I4U23_001022 [Adineta vaga]|nr:hypothetical protein I4U23_001022 [Adineta vaga]